MQRFIPLSVLTLAITACEGEGIDRASVQQPVAPQVISADDTSPQTPVVTPQTVPEPANGNDGNDGNSSSDDDSGNTNPGPDNSDSSDNNDASGDTDNDVNLFGGSGSSNGPSNDDPAPPPAPTTPTPAIADTTFNTEAPTSGTTFVSTMSPIRSETGPFCLRPQLDEAGNLITNEHGCPQLQYHGQLKFGDFMLSSNAWNYCASSLPDWEQCVEITETAGAVAPRWEYDWGNESDVNGAVWLVKSYPEVIYGIKSPGEFTGTSLTDAKVQTGLPAKVSDLPYYKIDYSFSAEEFPTRSKPFNGTTLFGERNVAVESFFHELDAECSPESLIRNGTTSNQRFEIMVWLESGAERLPAGPNDYVTTVTLDNIVYDVYTKPSDVEYIAFVSQSPTPSGSINWTTFIDWTRANGHRVNELFGQGSNTVQLQDDWCLANILLGTEIWWGHGAFQADEWTIHRTER